MRLGGPRSAIEEIYLFQAELAERLHADIREVVEELRGYNVWYQEMAAPCVRNDQQLIDSVARIAKALESLASQATSMPDTVQTALNSADLTELHRRLTEALTVEIWAQLGAHSDTEAKRFADIATRIEKNVHAAVQDLRDANAAKPNLTPATAGDPVTEGLSSKFRSCYVHLLRLSKDLQPLAVIFAGVCLGLSAIALMFSIFSRMPLSD